MARSPAVQLAAARKLLSDARLIAFFRAAQTAHRPVAIRIINRELGKGKSLDAFFDAFENAPGDRQGLQLTLNVKRLSPRVYTIVYGLSGGHVGDGGEWRVSFSAGAKVLRIQERVSWIA
ncbi:MAG: hypothetical protein JNM62_09225 [Flavobacteriales bacterium]|nr:hypothetical protein [Flavobacteriales bacterium]